MLIGLFVGLGGSDLSMYVFLLCKATSSSTGQSNIDASNKANKNVVLCINKFFACILNVSVSFFTLSWFSTSM